ncbi:acyl-CoA dehydrogenase family protein [Streptacidiphilus albus]|uniref:acyl-CoA dehydrogenase family protein n=1 Tax=Streptacidiphilus albus TaxID=105425 RepID=UPI00054C6BA5|nr:acyl-CoA dehydrogenase family protein [Streptacidiphilus albus]
MSTAPPPGTAEQLRDAVQALLATHDPATTPVAEFLGARYDAGLAWIHFPAGFGGLGAPRALQQLVNEEFAAAGAPVLDPGRHGIGLGMAAPTILAFGDEEIRRRFLRPLWTGEEVWCQLFSEPGAGSDLAALGTRAVRDGSGDGAEDADWIVDGQKVWTSLAHEADWAILVTRSDPAVPKHRGMTYFLCDMHAPGVEVRPLRQATGEAEFNEVFLTGVRIPDRHRLGAVGDGWRVATTTLMNERVAIGGQAEPREGASRSDSDKGGGGRRVGGLIGLLATEWRERPELRTPGLHDALLRLWVDAEAARLTGERLRQQLASGAPGPEGSAAKLAFARLNQQISGLELELLGEEGLVHDDWSFRRPTAPSMTGGTPTYRYLRAKGNSIEGGTSEILRGIIAERVLGLPQEIRVDKDVAWKDLPR